MTALDIRLDDLTHADVRALIGAHLTAMHDGSPAESVHALDLLALGHPSVRVFTAWSSGMLAGVGAWKALDTTHGEIKSMRVADHARGTGVGRSILRHLLADAREQRVERLSLETGSQASFTPAVRLYESEGFTFCAPFGSYVADPNSFFMTRAL